MKNFFRAVKLALQFRWTLVGAVIMSLVIAFLWGGNIGALYPVFEVSFAGKSLQEWADDEIKDSKLKLVEMEKEIAALQQQKKESLGDSGR